MSRPGDSADRRVVAGAASGAARSHASFGLPLGTMKPDPNQFTRAHAGEPVLPPPAPPSRPKEHLKPALPGRDEAPVMGLVTTKNFVVANAVENMLAPAKKPAPPPPPATAKADYGKVPAYIHDHKARLEADKEAALAAQRAAEEAAIAASGVRELTEAEREELLSSLRARWQRLHTAYMKLPLACDSDPKKRRKEAMEQELSQLEADIATLSKPGPVLVATDA